MVRSAQCAHVTLKNGTVRRSVVLVRRYADGSWYLGDFAENRPHGEGLQCYGDGGSWYFGGWKRGLKHGAGIELYKGRMLRFFLQAYGTKVCACDVMRWCGHDSSAELVWMEAATVNSGG